MTPEDPRYPFADWKYEVANDDTVLGYTEWVLHQHEADELDNHPEVEHGGEG